MSTISVDRVKSNLLPLPEVDGLNERRTLVASENQTIFDFSSVELPSGPVRAFVEQVEVEVERDDQQITITSPVTISEGDRFHVYAQVALDGLDLFDELGTAAFSDITESNTDGTAGRVLKVGDFGLGDSGGLTRINEDLNDIVLSGFYSVGQSATNVPVSGSNYLIVTGHNANNIAQIFIERINNRIYTRSSNNSLETWTDWEELAKTSDLDNYVPTARTVNAGTGLQGGGDLSANRHIGLADNTIPLRSTALGTTNLNTLNTLNEAGFYSQPSNVNATTARNYPANLAGSLTVTLASGNTVQEYRTYISPTRTFTRSCYNNTWGAWNEVITADVGFNQNISLASTAATGIAMTNSGRITTIGSRNASSTHYQSSTGNHYFYGATIAQSNVTAYSDERLKTNWRSLSDNFVESLAKVKNGIYDRIDTKETQVGVGAQSFKKILPEAIFTTDDRIEGEEGGFEDTHHVAYGNAALAAAVELAKEIVNLKDQLNSLKDEIKELKK